MPNSVRKLIKNGIEYGGIFVQGGSPAITVVDVPDSHGGIEKRITAVDISDTTAQAADVASGKVFYTADGTQTTGTASGGGGGDFETGVLVGDGTVHSSYITIPVSKQYSHFALLIDDITGHVSGDFFGCWGTPTMYIGVKSTGTSANGQISSDSRGVYLKFTASDIKFMPAVNGAYCKMIQDANYRWIAW